MQHELFTETPRPQLIKSPWCIRADKHCGHLATVTERLETTRVVNVESTCLECGRRGVVSARKDLLKGPAARAHGAA